MKLRSILNLISLAGIHKLKLRDKDKKNLSDFWSNIGQR